MNISDMIPDSVIEELEKMKEQEVDKMMNDAFGNKTGIEIAQEIQDRLNVLAWEIISAKRHEIKTS